jgi:hypothetical protein
MTWIFISTERWLMILKILDKDFFFQIQVTLDNLEVQETLKIYSIDWGVREIGNHRSDYSVFIIDVN